MSRESFEWHPLKDIENQRKHGVSFRESQLAFLDPNRIIHEDLEHSQHEKRFYYIGKVNSNILTVRFTYRRNNIRIFGAGYWRKGRIIYEEEN